MKTILDVCCGSKMFWFQKDCKKAVYMDIRKEQFDICGKHVDVHPDVVGDFRKIPFDDETFQMVVFDPPHLRWAGKHSNMKAQYGQLNDDWKVNLTKGFPSASVYYYLVDFLCLNGMNVKSRLMRY